jgi:branched-chain amino acid transport system substrate-binding protein
MRWIAGCTIVLLGCASTHVSGQRAPGETAALTPPPRIPGGDLGGDADFRVVANRAAKADPMTARAELEGFIRHHPNHFQRPTAVAMLCSTLLELGDAVAAKQLLDDATNILPNNERELFVGIDASQLGSHARALAGLRKYVAADPPAMTGVNDRTVRSLLRLALAESLAAEGDVAGGIDQLELYAQLGSNHEPERSYALRRADELAARAGATEASALLSGRHGAFARAALGRKAAESMKAHGDVAGATQYENQTLALRRQLGLEPALAWEMPADPLRLGMVIPLSGAQARLGEVVLRGAALVTSTTPGATQPNPFRLMLRDSAAGPDRSTAGGGPVAGILSLAREEKVIGSVAVAGAREVEVATREGLPLVLLDERAPGTHSTAFPMIHSPDARVQALARSTLALGVRRFAILAPNSVGGQRLAAAFKHAVERAGGTVTGQVTYAPGTTSFATEVANLRRIPFEALFVPDDAGRLELIAPALAVADIWTRSPRSFSNSAHELSSSTHGRREILLSSTALGLSPKFLRSGGRYLQGALLCPGFYPVEDARSGTFVSKFRDNYGVLPTATDAYGYDAAMVLRAAVERGAKSRADVVRVLASQTFEGLTGMIRFGPDHARVDPPLVYVVDGDGVRLLQ